jgi:hypothetical protein
MIRIPNAAFLFPLGVDVTAFWKPQGSNANSILIFAIVLSILVAALILINIFMKKSPAVANVITKGTEVSVARNFSSITLHRIAKSYGLDQAQTKMLDFVLKNDSVTNIERSLSSTELVDRHFKRAYHHIERMSISDDEAQEKIAVLFSTRNTLENNSPTGNITSTRQLPENVSAVLNVGSEKYNTKIISTKGESLNVECPENNAGTPIRLPRGSKLSIVIFSKSSKGFFFETRVLGTSNPSVGQILQLAHSSQIKYLSMRKFRRKQAVIACNFFFVYAEDAGKKEKKLVVDKRRMTGNIMDISAGGCSIKASVPVAGGAKLKIEYVHKDNATVAALGQVLRTNRTGISTVMHIKFIKIPRRSLNAINAFVFDYDE